MVQSGCGFWISFKEESLIRLYHVETFQHLQDINIASAVTRALKHKARKPGTDFSRGIAITCLMASRGILWIGTNKGITLSLPLPRLEGVPLISRGPSVSCHTHIGPVKFLVGICPEVIIDPVPGRAESFQGDANGENVDVKDTDRLELPCSAGDASATSPLSSPSPKATSPKCPPESASGSGSQTMPAVVSPKSKRKSKGDIRRISLSHVSEKTERTSDREVIRSYSIEHSFKPLKANAKSKWKSTPIGLDAIDKVEYDDDISVLYGSLLKGTGTEDYEDVLVQTSGEHGYMTLQATGADLLRYRKTKTASIMFPKRRVKSMASPAVGETAHTFSFDSAVKLRSYNRTSSELTSSFESVDETEEDIATPASDDVDESDAAKSSDRKLHNLHCKSVIVVSGGDGYLNWNVATPRDKKQEDARLILWQCKVA
ncbi:uncharacterized protein LOC106161669 [Lingula anatina]|uniref:Uncharacterized protein LOC106161669 n=1 Tax=Lingula anatina TaxID=7574 RepID=A0A1S3I9R1_LINAN|nr:uncharacterized protein LOC106161669 [Lingula anatina]|eukprot:XP_013394139.1 uncharacterized protein LOC106161669 [Lingula anatina]